MTQLIGNRALAGRGQGFDLLVAQRGEVRGATAVVVGAPSRFEEIQLFTGLDIYPEALTLVPGASKPLRVQIVDDALVGTAASGTRYVSGNAQVLSVGADGLITGLAPGQADVTIVHRGAEFVVPVRVTLPLQEQATLGADGGALRAADGSVLTIPPHALDGTQVVSIRPVAEAQLPLAPPPGWGYLGAWNLQFEGSLETAAQLAVPVPESVPVGKTLYLMWHGSIPDAEGRMTPIWWQKEALVVGADHIARTASPPFPGVLHAGVYSLFDPPEGVVIADGRVTMNVPVAIQPMMATLLGVMASEVAYMAVTFDIGQLSFVAIPQEGLPIVTTTGVQLRPGVVNTVDVVLDRAPDRVPQAPIVLATSFEFRTVGGQTKPVAVMTGRQIGSLPGTSGSSRFVAMWRQEGQVFEATAVGGVVAVGGGLEQLTVEIPPQVIAGIAELQLVRVDTIVGLDECGSGQLVPIERAYASNRMRLPPGGDLIAAGMYGIHNGKVQGEVGLFTQGDPFAANPEDALQVVARIPVGKDPAPGVPYAFPRVTALTADHTRAYVTLSGQHAVAVVDTLAMQQVDANIDTPEVDQIELPASASPHWITLDANGRYAYVGDENGYNDASGSLKGRIYVIDIDPKSERFHELVETIEVDAAGFGLRELKVSADGKRLYAAAPNRDGTRVVQNPADPTKYLQTLRDRSLVVAVNIDPADRPEGFGRVTTAPPPPNPQHYWKVIGKVDTGQETYALQLTGDPLRVLYTNRFSDAVFRLDPNDPTSPIDFAKTRGGVGEFSVGNDDPQAWSAEISRAIPLNLGSAFDTFDVNNGQALLVLPANALESSIGPHPEYIFVAAFNRFIQGVPSSDPDAFRDARNEGFGKTPSGSNIGIIRDGQLVAATMPIPIGGIDNLVFASGYNYLTGSYRGVTVGEGGMGAVFTWNLVNLVGQVETSWGNALKPNLDKAPIELHYFDQMMPLQENLQYFNSAINIGSDYRLISQNPNLGRFSYGVPYQMDMAGRYTDENGSPLPWMRDSRGQWAERIETTAVINGVSTTVVRAGAPYLVVGPDGIPRPGVPPGLVISPFGPIATGGSPRGLSAHETETAPGPRVWNQLLLGRKWGVEERQDLGLQDLLADVQAQQDCPDPHYNSEVQLDTGAVIETHELVPYFSLGQTQQLQLVYNSTSADVRPILNFGYEGIQAELAAYLANAPADELSPSGHALLQAQVTFTGKGGSYTTPKQYWQVASNATDINVALQADLSSLPSGPYSYTIQVRFLGKDRQEQQRADARQPEQEPLRPRLEPGRAAGAARGRRRRPADQRRRRPARALRADARADDERAALPGAGRRQGLCLAQRPDADRREDGRRQLPPHAGRRHRLPLRRAPVSMPRASRWAASCRP